MADRPCDRCYGKGTVWHRRRGDGQPVCVACGRCNGEGRLPQQHGGAGLRFVVPAGNGAGIGSGHPVFDAELDEAISGTR